VISIYNAKYYDKIALSIPGYTEIIDRIVQIVHKKSYYTVLDVGTGTGRIPLKLADKVFKIVAVDISQEMLDKLDKKIHKKHIDNIQPIKRNIADWSFLWPNTNPILSECAFNSVICSFILHHINTKWKKIVLERLRESLTLDGLLIIADVDIRKAWKIKKLANHIYWELIKKRENKYPICFILRQTLSYLFFEHPLLEESWIRLLTQIGYGNVKFETFNNFILIWARSKI